nr:MAG TPA: hypothetical protein [Caudoviricetes sp.]
MSSSIIRHSSLAADCPVSLCFKIYLLWIFQQFT